MIGVSIGSGSIKLVQFVSEKDNLHLVYSACAEMTDIEKIDYKVNVIKGLKEVFKGVTEKNADVICVVNCPRTSVAKIRLPVMPEEELAQAVRWGAKNQFPFSLDEAVMDYKVLDKSMDGEHLKLNVLAATTTRENINLINAFFNSSDGHRGYLADCRLTAVIPSSLALENIFMNSVGASAGIFAVIEMERTITEFNVYKNGKIEFSRKLPFCGNDITLSLTKALVTPKGKVELTFGEAEQMKIKYGIPEVGQVSWAEERITPNQLLSMMRPKLELLVNEIDRSLEFYQGERGERIHKVILRGGLARMKGLEQHLSQELDVDIRVEEIVDNVPGLSGITSDIKKSPSHRLDLAIGAVLHGPDDINFLPNKARQTQGGLPGKIFTAVSVLCVFSLVIFMLVNVSWRLNKSRKNHMTVTRDYQRLVPEMKRFKEELIFSKHLAQRPSWGAFLRGLSHQVLPRMYLHQMSMADHQVRLKGYITPEEGQDSGAALSEFMRNLQDGICPNVGLVEAKKDTDDINLAQFEIICDVSTGESE